MRNLIWIAMFTAACGAAPPPEPEPAPAPEPVVEEDPTHRPALTCKDGATQQYQAIPDGHEHFCAKDGVKHGPYHRVYTDGQRAIDGSYIHGEEDGPWSWYHPTGEKAQKGLYRKGRQMGPWQTWHTNGEIEEIGDYLNGRRSGLWTRFHESGRKAEDGMYLNDMKNGAWSHYLDDDGNTVERTETWQSGQLTATRPGK